MTDLGQSPTWENEAIQKILLENLKEQRRGRRWSVFFKFTLFIYLFILLWLFWPIPSSQSKKVGGHTALIDINGPIFDAAAANADNVVSGLTAAFNDKNTKGVVIRINSPGGSPVQADYIFNEIRRLQEKHPDIPVYTVCSDLCASAGYYIASAGKQIFANENSLVGSIGVLYNGFGFVDTMKKVGVERRLITSGSNKGFLDPFMPMKQDDKLFVQSMLDSIHSQFINTVKTARGKRLSKNANIYSGLIWTGTQAKQLGLIDNFGNSSYVAREVILAENIVDFTFKPSFFEKFAKQIGSTLGKEFAGQLDVTQQGMQTWNIS